jgi:hypothetical protein
MPTGRTHQVDDPLDFEGRDVLAAPADRILEPTGKDEMTVALTASRVRNQPSGRELLPRLRQLGGAPAVQSGVARWTVTGLLPGRCSCQ